MGLTPEEALKMQIDTLKEQLRQTTETLTLANQEIERTRSDEAAHLKIDLMERGGFKAEDLENKTNEDLRLMQITLDRAGITGKSAGIKKSIDERRNTKGLTVGRYRGGKWEGAE